MRAVLEPAHGPLRVVPASREQGTRSFAPLL